MSNFSFPELLTPNEVAEQLGISTQTLANWRCGQRYDLPYVKAGGRVKYDAKDVVEFIDRNRQSR